MVVKPDATRGRGRRGREWGRDRQREREENRVVIRNWKQEGELYKNERRKRARKQVKKYQKEKSESVG